MGEKHINDLKSIHEKIKVELWSRQNPNNLAAESGQECKPTVQNARISCRYTYFGHF